MITSINEFKLYLESVSFNDNISTNSKELYNILKDKEFIKRIDNPSGQYLHNIDLIIHDNSIQILQKILEEHNWYISRNRNNLIEISQKYIPEAKVNNIPKKLYHVTPTENVNKILSKGLIAKSEDIRHKYPNRIYVADNIISLKNLVKELKRWKGNNNYSILEIDTKKLNFNLYKDDTSAYIGNYYIQDINKIPKDNIKLLNQNINESVSFNDNIEFKNDHLNTHHDQHDFKLKAILNGEIVGYVEYSIFRDEVFINMIESLVSGKNVGPTMMKWLADKYGYENIERTQLTPAGMKLRKKMDDYFEFDYKKHKKDQNKHLDTSIIDKIRNKHPLVADFMSDMILYGYTDTWTKWLPKIDAGKFKYLDVLDLNEVSDITEWIKNSATNNNSSDEDVPEPVLKDLEKLL